MSEEKIHTNESGANGSPARNLASPFGRRFVGASLSQSLLSDSNLNVIKKWLDSERKFLVFVGNPGIGKTYHCAAVYNWIVQHKKNKDDFIRYYSEANFLNKMRSSINEFSGSYVEHMQ